jgi:putative transposase
VYVVAALVSHRQASDDGINNLFQLRREYVTASEYRAARARAFEVWSDLSGAAARA